MVKIEEKSKAFISNQKLDFATKLRKIKKQRRILKRSTAPPYKNEKYKNQCDFCE